MSLLILLTLFLDAFDSASALAHPPRQTTAADNLLSLENGWTPKPTPPALAHNGAGSFNNDKYAGVPLDLLFRRQITRTCGYVDGNADAPLTCSTGDECAFWYSTSPLAFACCPPIPGTSSSLINSDCPYISACLNYGDNGYSGSADTISSSDGVLTCGSALPSCWTIANSVGTSTWFYYGCATSSLYYNAAVYASTTSTNGGSSTPSSSGTPSSTGGGSSSTSTSSTYSPPPIQSHTVSRNPGGAGTTSTDINTPGGAPSTSSGSSTTSTTASSTSGVNKSSTNVGAIAGGTVGGVAGVALIAAAVGFLIYRKRKQRVEAMPEISQYDGAGYTSRPTGAHF